MTGRQNHRSFFFIFSLYFLPVNRDDLTLTPKCILMGNLIEFPVDIQGCVGSGASQKLFHAILPWGPAPLSCILHQKAHGGIFVHIRINDSREERRLYTEEQYVQWPVATFYAFYIIWCFSKLLPHTRQHILFVVKGISQRTNPKIHFRVMPN